MEAISHHIILYYITLYVTLLLFMVYCFIFRFICIFIFTSLFSPFVHHYKHNAHKYRAIIFFIRSEGLIFYSFCLFQQCNPHEKDTDYWGTGRGAKQGYEVNFYFSLFLYFFLAVIGAFFYRFLLSET